MSQPPDITSSDPIVLDSALHAEVKQRVQRMVLLQQAAQAAIADLQAAMVRELSDKLGIDLATEPYTLDHERGVLTRTPQPEA